MNKTVEHWDTRIPLTAEECDAILRELQAIVESPYFCNSKRYPSLLRYLVENALNGRSELLKERTLGIEVFDRQPTYDTGTDTVVRYTAGEVRKRLLLYYSKHSSISGFQISLPPGSYVPEFLADRNTAVDSAELAEIPAQNITEPVDPVLESSNPAESESSSFITEISALSGSTLDEAQHDSAVSLTSPSRRSAYVVLTVCTLILAIGAVAFAWKWHTPPLDRAVNDFWAPVLHDQHLVLVCTGGVVFQKNDFSGVITAGKDNDYPFVSMQAASAIAQVSALIDHSGAATKLLPSPTTSISELRDHPLVLLGGYNNRWTMSLLQSLRYQFTPEPLESITDQKQPQMHWTRDRSRPYAGTDDYAIIARYRDGTTGDWVIVLAGLGRNGTEAAAQFATSPHSMKLLEDRVGGSIAAGKNIEAVLKVRVVEGKTGASSIETAIVW